MTPYCKIVVVALAVAGSFASPALAHHVMGGEVPRTAWQGLLSGLGHPIIGIDHFAFVVGVGLMSYLAGRMALLPLLFVAATVLGCLVHIQGYTVPMVEWAIVLGIAAAAAVVGARIRAPAAILALLLVVAGAAHGYAYGESIVGAEAGPLIAYVLGFGAVQYAVAVGGGAALRVLVARDYVSETLAMRTAGGGLALLAAFALVSPIG